MSSTMTAPASTMRRSPSPTPHDAGADLEAGRHDASVGDDSALGGAAAAAGASIPRRASPYTSPSKTAYAQAQSESVQINADSVRRYGQAVGMRVVRTVRKGQFPLMLLFFCCVLVFFGALTGFGYVDPDSTSLYPSNADAAVAEFVPGQPVFDRAAVVDEASRAEEMRKLEAEWARQKRPKDGAWMKKQRDQRAVRRVPLPNSPGSRPGAAAAAA